LDISLNPGRHITERLREDFRLSNQIRQDVKEGTRKFISITTTQHFLQSATGLKMQISLQDHLDEKIRIDESIKDFCARRSGFWYIGIKDAIPVADPRNVSIGYNRATAHVQDIYIMLLVNIQLRLVWQATLFRNHLNGVLLLLNPSVNVVDQERHEKL